jgi:hypothetical protein
MVKCSVLFEVRTEFLNIIWMSSSTLSNESWNKILPSLSQGSTTHHPNVFTPILPLSEGRAGIAWVPSNKMIFFSPSDIKRLSISPQMFSLFFYSYTILSDSLSLRLQWDNGILCDPVLLISRIKCRFTLRLQRSSATCLTQPVPFN